MGEVTELVRGSLTEQYLTRTDASGKSYQAGPYYVRTWYADGRKHTERVSSSEVSKVERRIRNYQKMKDLFDELLDVIEEMTKQKP